MILLRPPRLAAAASFTKMKNGAGRTGISPGRERSRREKNRPPLGEMGKWWNEKRKSRAARGERCVEAVQNAGMKPPVRSSPRLSANREDAGRRSAACPCAQS